MFTAGKMYSSKTMLLIHSHCELTLSFQLPPSLPPLLWSDSVLDVIVNMLLNLESEGWSNASLGCPFCVADLTSVYLQKYFKYLPNENITSQQYSHHYSAQFQQII
jgi:hypothetical protein